MNFMSFSVMDRAAAASSVFGAIIIVGPSDAAASCNSLIVSVKIYPFFSFFTVHSDDDQSENSSTTLMGAAGRRRRRSVTTVSQIYAQLDDELQLCLMCEWLPKNTASLLLPAPILQQLLHDEHDEQELPDLRDLDCMKFSHRK
jgi:hypothetical protein